MYCDAYFNDDRMWYFDNELQALCELNLDNYRLNIVAQYNKGNKFISHKIFYIEGILYITFYNSSGMLKYDMKKDELGEIVNEEEIQLAAYDKNSYDFHVEVDNRIWVIPRYMEKTVYYFDLAKEQFYQDDKLNKSIGKYVKSDQDAVVYASGYGTQVWSVIWNTHQYFRYDLHSGEIEIFQLKNSNIRLNSACYDGKNVWLTQVNSTDLICVGDEEYIISIEEKGDWQESQYSKIVNLEDNIIALPRYGNKIILVNKRTRMVKKIEIGKEDLSDGKIKGNCSKIVGCYEVKGKIYLFPWGIADLHLLDREKMNLERVNIQNDSEVYREYMHDLLKNKISVNECNHISLEEYREWLVNNGKQGNTQSLKSGTTIFRSLID